MTSIPGTEGFAPWLQLVAVVSFMVTIGVIAALAQVRGRKEAQRVAQSEKGAAERQMGAIMAIQPTADRMTIDALVQTGAKLNTTLERLIERMDREERERDAEREAELAELRRLVRGIKSSTG